MTTLAYFRQWTRPGVLATLLVAFMTFMIEIQVAELETQRASVSRSVALYRDFVSSESMKKLSRVRHQIELILWKTGGSPYKQKLEVGEKRIIEVFNKPEIANDIKIIRESLVDVFQKVYLIYNCGHFRENDANLIEKQKINDSLCDQGTVSTLLGGVLLDLFFAFRPVIYCDMFFLDNYFFQKKPGLYIQQFESLVMNNLRQDMHDRGKDKTFGIFRTEAERKTAISEGKFSKDATNYAVLRSTLRRCQFYR